MIKIQIRAIELAHLPPPEPELLEWTDLENMPNFDNTENARKWLIQNDASELERWGFEFQIIDVTPPDVTARAVTNDQI
jgi:hypothetical protein